MSKKIPFLEMFAALRQLDGAVNAMERLDDRGRRPSTSATRSAVVAVEGASGAGPNLIAQAEEAVARCYGLHRVKLELAWQDPSRPAGACRDRRSSRSGPEQPAQAAPSAPAPEELQTPQDAFARAEAIRKPPR